MQTLSWADPHAPSCLPPCLPAYRYDFFSGQEVVLGAHEAGAKCVEWLPTRGLLATAGWDRCGEGVGARCCGGPQGVLLRRWAASACTQLDTSRNPVP